MKIVYKVIKKVVLALCMLYTINLIVSKTGIIIPINVTSITITSILGLPAVLGLIVLYKIMM
jgi:pro-sigmaK processing inhibitor BofA